MPLRVPEMSRVLLLFATGINLPGEGFVLSMI